MNKYIGHYEPSWRVGSTQFISIAVHCMRINGRSEQSLDLTVSATLKSRGPQQAEILDTDAEIRAEILLEIRDPKSQAIFF